MSAAKYRYTRNNFKPLPVTLEHMDIHLDFHDDKVEGCNTLTIRALRALDTIELDARDLRVTAVEWLEAESAPSSGENRPGRRGRPIPFEYQETCDKLVVSLPSKLRSGDEFRIRTRTTCVPSDSILEGIYKDTTPPGCPQQYMSQCQQWGFQRILPVFDDCTAKCTFRTTIEADSRYTHLISNGNASRETNPDGKPVLKPGEPGRKIITYENPVRMAPYLFLVCVGTWDEVEDEIVYPSGRRVVLQYLVPPGKKDGASIPMQILKKSVLWQGHTQDYEYPFDVYRTICMEKSNFGGMENLGNTTILTSAALIDEYSNDARIKYAYKIIIHEFEHNQCGSDVTMETPFDMWLNEAFTVDVERQFTLTQFDPACTRLEQVDGIRAPVGGPLAVEDAGHIGNIVREGFNHPDELVDGVTYVKAAEVIRMLRLVLGADKFRAGKNLYFKRYGGRNADTGQFFACFEEVSGRDLSRFKSEWLHTIGYPRIEARHSYDARNRRLTVTLRQSRSGKGGLFHLPMEIAAVDAAGSDMPGTGRMAEISEESAELVFENIAEPAFLSINRDFSFYGSFADLSSSPAQLVAQVRSDPNLFNRVEAMRRLTDIERTKLIEDPAAEVGAEWLDTFGSVLADRSVGPGLKAFLLAIGEDSLDRRYLTFHRERYAARRRLLLAAAERFRAELIGEFHSVDTYSRTSRMEDGMEKRGLKAVLLRVLTEANTAETQGLAESHFRKAWNISDKLSALNCVYISDHPRRLDLMEEGFHMWKDHIGAYSDYLSIVGSGTHEDVFDLIERESKRPVFKLHHPSHQRALFIPMTSNNKMLWTDRGIRWVAETAVKLAPINEVSAARLLACFQHVNKLAPDLKPKVVEALKTAGARLDSSACPSVAGRINAYLGGA